MYFIGDMLSIDGDTDPRLCKLLLCLACPLGKTVQIDSFLTAAVAARDARILNVIARSLQPTVDLTNVLRELDACVDGSGQNEHAPRHRSSFCPEAIATLEDVRRSLVTGTIPTAAHLEFLILRILQNSEFGKSGKWGMLDRHRAIYLLQQEIDKECQGQSERREARQGATYVDAQAGVANGPLLPSSQIVPSENLTDRVRAMSTSQISPLSGDPQYEQVFDLLARALFRSRGHALLVGDQGVGQNMVLTELALRAVGGRIPFLAKSCILTLDCRYISPADSRNCLSAILRQLGQRKEAVLCLDGFGSLLQNEHGASNCSFLLSLLQGAKCRLIGIVTPRAFDEYFAADPDVMEFFTRVPLPEPGIPVAQKIVDCYADGLKQRFHLDFDDQLTRMVIILSSNYILNEPLPGKAVNLLHRVCEEIDYERSQLGKTTSRVTEGHVLRAVSIASGVPEETLRGIAEKSDYKSSLGEMIFGQGHAVALVAAELGLIKAGLTEPTKPASVMLFIGQTGTGKTEMAKALARFYSTSKRLRTYTLGNFSEPHSVAGIIGVPPGYVGHDQGGRLVNDLNADPYCVFLLDEADKAHPDVLQPFLNLFDEGWIRDQKGTTAYADKAIFILTTNVGQKMISDLAGSGKGVAEITDRMKEALSQIRHNKSNRPVFAPEFLARIKRFVVFMPLDKKAMLDISAKLVSDMQRSWKEKRGKRLDVCEKLLNHIAERSFELNEKSKGKEGGRIVRKLISDLIETPLQQRISEAPDEYRACDFVAVEALDESTDKSTAVNVMVRFC